MKASRRSTILAGGAIASAVTGFWMWARRNGSRTVRQQPTLHFHIVAHPDDDLYFFNPDLAQALSAKESVVTVCLTGGEADGKNLPANDPRFADMPVNFSGYVAARYAGLMSAYAAQTADDPGLPWTHEPMVLASGQVAEVYSLTEHTQIKLIFLNMWQEGARSKTGQPSRLTQLWTGAVRTQPTIVPSGSAATEEYGYAREDLVQCLASLLEEYRPTVVRIMDPDPDRQVHDADNPQFADAGGYSDHMDHTPVGLFALEALVRWWQRSDRKRVIVESYRGYFNRRWPANIGREQSATKLKHVSIYAEGDRKLGQPRALSEHAHSTHRRHALSTTWLKADHEGRLTAFSVLSGQPVMWSETKPGNGLWHSPQTLSSPRPLVSHLDSVMRADQRWQVFGIAVSLDADLMKQRRDVVTAVQQEPGGSFGEWQDLGNPDSPEIRDPMRHRAIGMPMASRVGPDGIIVFVRDLTTGVMYRHGDLRGTWGPWTRLQGGNTMDGLAVGTSAVGDIEVLATAKSGIARWQKPTATGSFEFETLRVPAPADPPTVLALADGRMLLLVRQPTSAAILGYFRDPDGVWSTTPITLGGHGYGPVAAACRPSGHIAVACRNNCGTVSYSIRSGANLADGDWTVTGPRFALTPSIAFDSSQHLIIAALRMDGRLSIARQQIGDTAQPTWTVLD